MLTYSPAVAARQKGSNRPQDVIRMLPSTMIRLRLPCTRPTTLGHGTFQQVFGTSSPRWASDGRPVGLLWASPDCKHFSKAKGGALDRSREIRSLAWVVEKWAREVRPRVIILENVEEFQTWGPLMKGRHHQGPCRRYVQGVCPAIEATGIRG